MWVSRSAIEIALHDGGLAGNQAATGSRIDNEPRSSSRRTHAATNCLLTDAGWNRVDASIGVPSRTSASPAYDSSTTSRPLATSTAPRNGTERSKDRESRSTTAGVARSPMIERMFPTIDRLNDEQRAAATFEGDQLRILAGAGTGKTTALTARVAWLVAGGIPAERVMALTFTRRAAREMMHRCETLLAEGSGASRHRRGPGSSAARSTRSRTAPCAATRRRSGSPRGSRCSTPATRPT